MRKPVLGIFLCLPTMVWGGNTIQNLQPRLDRPTVTNLGVQIVYTDDDNRNAMATLQYRKAGDASWRDAMNPLRVLPETVVGRAVPANFAGSVLDLAPDTAYELRVTIQDPDGPVNQSYLLNARTRAVPGLPQTPRYLNVSTVAGLQAALSASQPGDVITLQPGVYKVQWLQMSKSGTAANPIVIRGVSRDVVILDGSNCFCNIIEVYSSYVQLENMTIQSGSQAIRFQGDGAVGNVLRRVRIRDVDNAVNTKFNQLDFYYGDSIFQGRIPFPLTWQDDNGARSGPYGIAVNGHGHVIVNNQFQGFGDAVFFGSAGSRAVDFIGNDILHNYDDGIETDFTEGNIRVMRNRFTNSLMAMSVQPVYGGPVYLIRNVGFNLRGSQIKFNGEGGGGYPSGVVALHNTFVSPERSLKIYAGVPTANSIIQNNLFIGPTYQGGSIAEWFGALTQTTLNYNGYWPDGGFNIGFPSGQVVWPNFNAMATAGQVETNGRLLGRNNFYNGMIGPDTYFVYQQPQNMILLPTSGAIDQGVVIANVNDHFIGVRPDMGALEAGCPVPHYGPRPVAVNETNQVTGCSASNPAPNAPSRADRFGVLNRSVTAKRLTAWSSDPQGYADVATVELVVKTPSSGVSVSNACAIVVDRTQGRVWLWNDAGTARLGPLAFGAAGTLQNSLCSVNAATSVLSGIAEDRTVQAAVEVTFQGPFATATKSASVRATDLQGATEGFRAFGSFQ